MLKNSRKAVGFSQEHAAFLLHIGTRTLYEYEEKDDAPCDVIDKMAEIYQRPELRLWKCKKRCEIGEEHLPQIEIVDLPTAVLNLLRVLRREGRFIDNALIRLSCGQGINEVTWQKTRSKLRNIMGAIYSLEIAVEKEKAMPYTKDALYFCLEEA